MIVVEVKELGNFLMRQGVVEVDSSVAVEVVVVQVERQQICTAKEHVTRPYSQLDQNTKRDFRSFPSNLLLMHFNVPLQSLFEILIRALYTPLLNRLHKLIHLADLLIAHLIQQVLV